MFFHTHTRTYHTHCWTSCDGPAASRAGCESSAVFVTVPWLCARLCPQDVIEQRQSKLLLLSPNHELISKANMGPFKGLRPVPKVNYFLSVWLRICRLNKSVCVDQDLYFMHESGEPNSLSVLTHRRQSACLHPGSTT